MLFILYYTTLLYMFCNFLYEKNPVIVILENATLFSCNSKQLMLKLKHTQMHAFSKI